MDLTILHSSATSFVNSQKGGRATGMLSSSTVVVETGLTIDQRRLRMGEFKINLPPNGTHLYDLDRPNTLPRLHQGFTSGDGQRRLYHAPLPRRNHRHLTGRCARRNEDESHYHSEIQHTRMRSGCRIRLPFLLLLAERNRLGVQG
jgi:hypothetical protein